MTSIPYPRSYWVNDSLLAGFYPGSSNPLDAEMKIKGILDLGITQFVSLMEPEEFNHQKVPFTAYQPTATKLSAKPLLFQCFSIRDGGVPTLELGQKIVAHLQYEIERGEKIYLHCWGGRGRTGMAVCLYLMTTEGLSAKAAQLKLASLIHPRAALFEPTPETPAQFKFLDQFEKFLDLHLKASIL